MSKKNTNKAAEAVKENEAVEVVEAVDVSEAIEAAKEVQQTKPASSSEKKKSFNARKFKHGTASVVLTIVFVAVIVMVNVIVGLISERFDTDVDLSAAGMYTLEEDTEEYLKGVDKPVTITVLNSESNFEAGGDPYKQVNELLKKMQLANDNITLEYLILDQNPGYAAEFTGEQIADNYIVVECPSTNQHKIISGNLNSGNGYLVFDQEAYYNAYYTAMYSGGSFAPYDYLYSNIEQEVVSALMFVTNDDPVRVAFTTGYEELDSSALQELLGRNGYAVETVNLMQVEQIDPEIDFVVMFAPVMDIDNENLAKLDKFLDNGGKYGKNVIYFGSAFQEDTPNIDAFLADWGMAVDKSLVGQSDGNYVFSYAETTGYYFGHHQQFCDSDFVGSTYGIGLYTYGANMRPVIQLWDGGARGDIEQEILMQSYDGAFTVPFDVPEDYEVNEAEMGVYNDGIVAYRVHSTEHTISRLAVFGSEKLASSMFMGYSNSNNSKFFINMFNYICGKEEGVTITSKSFATTGFDMTTQQADTLAVFLCIVIPVAVIALGIIIWVRRRHR